MLDVASGYDYRSGNIIAEKYRNRIASYKRIAKYTATDDKKIDLLVINLKEECDLDRPCSSLRNFVMGYLNAVACDVAMATFVAHDKKQVLQFNKITLLDTEPEVWRQIQIAETCTFWDLHVAIQDAMGWQDCHLHMFRILYKENPNSRKRWIQHELVGIPNTEFGISEVLADWETKIEDYLAPEYKIIYEYDFGDGWEHEVEFEGYFERVKGNKYPCCLAGEMACPPEDVGGIPGYYDFIEVMNDIKHPEYESMLDWYGGKFDSQKFDAGNVKFHNAKSKLKKILD